MRKWKPDLPSLCVALALNLAHARQHFTTELESQHLFLFTFYFKTKLPGLALNSLCLYPRQVLALSSSCLSPLSSSDYQLVPPGPALVLVFQLSPFLCLSLLPGSFQDSPSKFCELRISQRLEQSTVVL